MITKGLLNSLCLVAGDFAKRATSVSTMLVLATLVVFAAGCGLVGERSSNGSEGASPAPSASEEAATDQQASSGPCENPYYPIEPGVRKLYKSTASAAGYDTEITLDQKAPEGDTFNETRTLKSGLTVSTPWKCEAGGLRIAEYQNFIQSNKMNFTMETVESSGVTLPASWKAGDEWQSDYKIKVDLKAGPVNANAGGTVKISEKLVDEGESVKVEGGEFEAAKVESVIKIVVSYGGREIPSQDIKLTRWYSPKVGLVKQESSGPFGKETIQYAGVAQ